MKNPKNSTKTILTMLVATAAMAAAAAPVTTGRAAHAVAAWTALGDYETIKERVSKLTADRLEKSHLLNLDIREDVAYPGYSFTVEDIAVDDENITVKVKLTRTFRVTSRINGELRMYGAESLDGE